MSFSEIFGQSRAIAGLRSALQSEHLHHAYLFSGPDGVGKELTALTLAMAANCERHDGEACGTCLSCRKILSFNHPDIVWVMPEAELVARKRAGRADFSGTPSRDIRISQIRGIQEVLAFKPLEARTRFILICSAHAMNVQAQNALLKTLEEPPPSTVLLLITPALGQLLPTIRSRCLKVNFEPLPKETIANFLVDQKAMAPEMALRCASLSCGSLGAALNLDVKALEQLSERLENLIALDSGDVLTALQLAEALSGEKAALETTLTLFENWYRDVALVASVDSGSAQEVMDQLIFGDMGQQVEQSARKLGAVEALRRIGLCRGVKGRLKFNASARLQLEQLFMRFTRSDA